jgi:chromosome segregation ATPase
LQQQIDEARGTISTYESTMKDYERRLNNHANSVRMAEHEAARAKQLESNVRQLKEEKADIAQKLHNAQEYQVAFSTAAEQKISELEREKEGMIQDHQFAVETAAYRISAAERKIDEVEQKRGSADHFQTPPTRKRQRPNETPHMDGPATRGRKRRAAAQNEGDSDAAPL